MTNIYSLSATILFLLLFSIPKFSNPCIQMLNGWKQMTVGKRAKLAKVVFVGKVINLYSMNELSQTYAADFEIWRLHKGQNIVMEVLEQHPGPLVKVFGFGEKRLCYSPVNPGEVHLVFMVYEPKSRSLVARYDDIFGAISPPTTKNEDDVLQALGWRPWSNWSRCSKNCAGGEQKRSRICLNMECNGPTSEIRPCNSYRCYGVKDVTRLLRDDKLLIPKHDIIKLENGSVRSLKTSEVFPYYFPEYFSIVITFRTTILTDIYLIAWYDFRNSLRLGVRITSVKLSLEFEQNSMFLYRPLSLDFDITLRKEQWHNLGISIQDKEATVYWGCKKTATKKLPGKLNLIRSSLGEIYFGKPLFGSLQERFEVELAELYFVPDSTAAAQQCSVPKFQALLVSGVLEGSGGAPGEYGPEGSGTPYYVDDHANEVEISWSEWSPCSETCGKGQRKRVMMCDLESSHSDVNGLPSEKCIRALQTEEVKACYLQECPAHCDSQCLNGGFCVSRNHCQCQPGYSGDVCEKVQCRIHCLNGGSCVGLNTCTCPSGYGGIHCEKVVCSTPCSYGGRCIRPNLCRCSSGFLAPNCRPSCSPRCLNGGSCVGPNKCRCTEGFMGKFCQKAVCTQPCMNGGLCYEPNKCSCLYGWHGKSCERARCYPGCQNGGSCIRRNVCACSRGYFGYYCQYGAGKKNVVRKIEST